MALFLFALVVNLLIQLRKHTARTKPQPICVDCVFAHVQYPSVGRPAISCIFGGVIRPMKLDVMYCTDYRDRYRKAAERVVGFAPGAAGPEPVEAELAAKG